MPNNICGDIDTKTSTERHHIQHMAPTVFGGFQNTTCLVPRPPPPPKNTKLTTESGQNIIISPNQLQPGESLQMSSIGTLKKKRP